MPYKGNKKLVPIARMLRRDMTRQERRLWYGYLSKYPVRFYRQKVLGKYIADFYCAKAKLIVELDGSQHFKPTEQARDEERSRFLEEYGLSVLRISNGEIDTNFEGVCRSIDNIVKERTDRFL
ncbi:MAG: endonuclease domain-containing protein [Clostridia bacterium]|nr:endonuclease domain-containing protein [Clostridia bacterium]